MALAGWTLPETSPHTGAPTPSTTDGLLAIWALGETVVTDNVFSTAGLSRTLTQHGSPTLVTSLYEGTNGTGARGFDGSTQYADRVTGDNDHIALLLGRIGFDAWVKPLSLVPGCLLTYEGNAAVLAKNCIFSVRMNSLGDIFTRWQFGSGSNVDATGPRLVVGTTSHVGITVEPDPDQFNRLRVSFWLNGLLVKRVGNLAKPAGGTSSRWLMGASESSGALATFFLGQLDDVAVYTFAPSTEFHRHVYSRGVKDWVVNLTDHTKHPFYEVHSRVLIQDRLGALGEAGQTTVDGFVDMTRFFGWNWLLSAEIDEDVEAQSNTATIDLLTRYGEMSLAPGDTAFSSSGVDFYKNVVNANGVFLAENNQVKIEIAVVPYGTTREQVDVYWTLRFHGLIARVDAGQARTRIEVTDLAGALQDTWMEPEPKSGVDYEYGTTVGVAVETIVRQMIDDMNPAEMDILVVDDNGGSNRVKVVLYDPTVNLPIGAPHLFAVGDRFLISNTINYDGEYDVFSTPAAPAQGESITSTQTTTGLLATNTAMGFVSGLESEFGYAGGGKPELYVPTSPGWNVFPFRQPASQPLSTAIEALVASIGYSCRYAWDDDRQQFRFTLARFAGIASAFMGWRHVLDVGSQRGDKENERNVIVTEYGSSSTLDSLGSRQRVAVAVTTPTARKRYGRRYARVGLESYSLVNTAAEALKFTQQMASDLDNPLPEGTLETTYHPGLVCGGYLNLPAWLGTGFFSMAMDVMPIAWASGATLGVIGLRTSMSAEGVRQTVTTRKSDISDGTGSVATPVRTKKQKEFLQGNGRIKTLGLRPPPTTGITCSGTGLSLGGAVRGLAVRWTHPNNLSSAAWDYTEVHVSSVSSSFTPAASTLLGTTRGTSFIDSTRAATTTYFIKIVLRDRMGNASAPISAAAGVTTP